MYRHTRSEAGDLAPSKAASFTSERTSVAGAVTFQMPPSPRPPPKYIAASVASQIVTDHHNAQRAADGSCDDADSDAGDPSAVFSEPALRLLNGFLDHLLFAFLSAARSPALTDIRPAITDVLKPRLAREAMATADDELQGLLGGDDEEEFPMPPALPVRWDVEKVWKRTRLRIMVYTRLGDLEDEDEDAYVQQERGLSMDDGADDNAGLVSWASAIFLTSVVEHIAEQTLLAAAHASYARTKAKLNKAARAFDAGDDASSSDASPERIVVEDYDVEKIALTAALGRLWRTWRKRVRSPRPMASLASLHSRTASHDTADTIDALVLGHDAVPDLPEYRPTETDIAANIPLPRSDNDVNEIEVPGLARAFDDDEGSRAETPVRRPARPTSVIVLGPAENLRRMIAKARPVSMPLFAPVPFVVPSQSDDADEFVTPRETSDDGSFITDEANADMVALAAFERNDDDDTINKGFAEPHVFQSKRMSIEKPGPPGIVRTFSTRSQRSSKQPTPPPQVPEPTSFLDDAQSDDDLSGPEAIGVARTSNVPILTPSPPSEPAGEPDHQGFVELAPRHILGSTSTPPMRRSPSPEDRPASGKPPAPRRQMSRELSSGKIRAPTLETLQETESRPKRPQGHTTPQRSFEHRSTSSSSSPKHAASIRARDTPVAVPERSAKRPSAELSPLSRTGIGEGLKRVSSSSTARSASTSILITGRDSDVSITRPRGLSHRMSEEDRVREFDSLVKSEDTVKFTLTPQSMREPSLLQDDDPQRPTSAVAADIENQFGSLLMPTYESRSLHTTTSSVRRVSVNSLGPKPLAREPRVNDESMRDFADFIRSTGPTPGRQRAVQPFVALTNSASASPSASSTAVNRLGKKASTTASPSASSTAVNRLGRRASTTASPSASSTAVNRLGRRLSGAKSTKSPGTSKPGLIAPSARPRVQMEPRSPAGRSGNDDLIDFIRQGPPGQGEGQRRIPRSVAPFRNTVDSDTFDQMIEENGGTLESGFGSQISSASKQSANSRTGLLPTPTVTVAQPSYSSAPQQQQFSSAPQQQQFSGNPGGPAGPEPHIQRTRRRVKDPYAIDLTDDEDDLLTALPPKRQEESLMDFLNATDPTPASNAAPQPFLLSEAAIATAKARAATLAANQKQHAGNSNTSFASSSSSLTAGRNNSSRKPAPLQGGTSSAYINSDAPRAYKPKLQARAASSRDAHVERSATNDLADFLRSSGPPPEPVKPAPLPKEQSKRSYPLFWRKRTIPDTA